MKGLVNSWAGKDPVEAGKFLEGLHAGSSRDIAIQSYVDQVATPSPELAATFVNLLAEEKQRAFYAGRVARNYLLNDPNAAAKWIHSLNLPKEEKQALLMTK
jgi:hypothetical protein